MKMPGIGSTRFARLLGAPAVRRLADYIRPTSDFATFWHGSLDPLTFTCLASFAYYDAPLRLYCYDPPQQVPEGVMLCDAAEIVADRGLLDRYPVRGRPSISKFSNLFRYQLIRKTGACWVDSDILCLRKPDLRDQPILFGRQTDDAGIWEMNGAVLKLPRRHPMLAELHARAKADVDIDTPWGVLGPMLITELARKHGLEGAAQPRHRFYPLKPGEFWKALLPEQRGAVAGLARNSTFLHLWHELYKRSKYKKNVAPPKGSYLHHACKKLDTLTRFTRTYRPEELRAMFAVRIAQTQAGMQPPLATVDAQAG
jgi:hypothetical protein